MDMTTETKGLEETLKEIIRIRIVQHLAKGSIGGSRPRRDLHQIMKNQAALVYGPVMEVVKLLADECGLKIEQNGGIVLPDTHDKKVIV